MGESRPAKKACHEIDIERPGLTCYVERFNKHLAGASCRQSIETRPPPKPALGSFIISSSNAVSGNTGTVDIESVKFAGSTASGMSTLTMSGNLKFTSNGIGFRVEDVNNVVSFSETSSSYSRDGDSISIGARTFGIIEFQQNKPDMNGCTLAAGPQRRVQFQTILSYYRR